MLLDEKHDGLKKYIIYSINTKNTFGYIVDKL